MCQHHHQSVVPDVYLMIDVHILLGSISMMEHVFCEVEMYQNQMQSISMIQHECVVLHIISIIEE